MSVQSKQMNDVRNLISAHFNLKYYEVAEFFDGASDNELVTMYNDIKKETP